MRPAVARLLGMVLLLASGPAAEPRAAARLTCPDSAPYPREQWAADLRAKNIDEILSLYTRDAVFIEPDGAIVRGEKDLRALYAVVFATYDSDITLTRTSLGPGSVFRRSACIEHGTFEEDLRLRADNSVRHFRGEYEFAYVASAQGAWSIAQQRWIEKPTTGAGAQPD